MISVVCASILSYENSKMMIEEMNVVRNECCSCISFFADVAPLLPPEFVDMVVIPILFATYVID